MLNWTKVPAGIWNGAMARFGIAIGNEADKVAERINTDPAYTARVAQFALDGTTQQVQPVSSDLARLLPVRQHMLADLRGLLLGKYDFTAADLDLLARAMPNGSPVGSFPVVLPVVYLETLEATVKFYWEICQRRYTATWQWPDLKLGNNSLRPWNPRRSGNGTSWGKDPRLGWVGLDLLAYYDPKEGVTVAENRAREQAPMPGVEILALMALAPALGQAMDGGVANGGKMPWLDLPGLKACVSGYAPWSVAPVFDFDRYFRGLQLGGGRVGNRGRGYASPAFRECTG